MSTILISGKRKIKSKAIPVSVIVVRVPGYRSRGPGVRFPALPDFLSSGSETGSTQPREYN
jgi:hypothetical protein